MARETKIHKDQAAFSAAEPSFEERMNRLEQIVGLLEKGEIPLAESVKLYKEGLDLSSKCKEEIEKAKHEVKILQNDIPEPFESFPAHGMTAPQDDDGSDL